MNNIEEKIKSQYFSLTKTQKRISRFIIQNLEETAFLSLSKLAQQARISEASINRFCMALGYDRYVDLQKDLQAWIKARITPLIKISKSIRTEPKKNIYSDIIDADFKNLENLLEKFPESQLEQAVKFIIKAQRVYVIGMRSSYAPAFLLSHYLNHIGISSELLDYQAGRLLDRVIHIGPQNVVIGISFPRYFRETVEVLDYAKSKGAKTIVITDTLLSPGAHKGDVVITAKYHTPIPFLSYVSTLSLINCLVFGVIMKRKNQSVALVAGIEQMLEEWKSCLAMDG